MLEISSEAFQQDIAYFKTSGAPKITSSIPLRDLKEMQNKEES